MNLQEFNSPLPKPWLNINSNSINANLITAGSEIIDDLEVKVLTLVNQAAVPNPAIGKMALFTDSVDQVLSSTDPLGVTVKYLQNPSSADQDMNGNEIKNVSAIRSSNSNIIFGSAANINSGNVALGNLALNVNTSGNMVAVGAEALALNVGGSDHTAVGYRALASSVGQLDCCAFGSQCLENANVGSNSCSGFGARCLNQNTSGVNNSAFGTQCMISNTTGSQQCAFGQNALRNNTTGGANNAFGHQALDANLTGNFNVAMGQFALAANTTGSSNTALGHGAGGTSVANDNTVSIGSNSRANAASARVLSSGAVCTNAVANSWLLGDSAVVNFRPDNNNLCDLGASGSVFKACYLIDEQVAVGSKFSQYTDVAVDNTVVETPITTGSSVGNLLYSPTIPLGTVFEFDVNFLVNSAAGDTLTLRYYSNAGLLLSHVITYAALTVNSAANIHTMMTVRNGALQINSIECVSGVVNIINQLAIVFDRTIANTFSVSAQWGLAASQFTCNQFFVKTNYRS